MKKKVLVFSADALVREDIAYLSTKPHFSALMKNAAQVTRVQSVYPAITYPAHAAILTGAYPEHNGVAVNGEFRTVNKNETAWLLEASCIKAEDLFAAAKRGGYTTASVYWPITGNNPSIDYNINEYFFPDPDETVEDGFRKFGANEDTLAVIRENMPRFTRREPLAGELTTRENCYEYFINGCACSLIRRYQPDLLLMHNCVVDNTRHAFGVFSENTYYALDLLDEWLGELVQAMKDAGVYEQTDFVLLSDHGQKDYCRTAHLNRLLLDNGFFTVDENNRVTDWTAYSLSSGCSTAVFLKDPNDAALRERVECFLRKAFMSGKYGIQQVYNEEEMALRYHLRGDYSFTVEALDGIVFRDVWTVDKIVSDPFPVRGNHGYMPEKGPWPVFLGVGPSFRPGAVVPISHLIHEAPTIAAILGVDMPQADGVCMKDLLR